MADRLDFLAGGGEMGALIRAKDWSTTPLGPAASWPQALKSAVSLLLPSRAQIVLFYGPELVTLYNDAYAPVFGGKHPHMLGMPAREAWHELWESGLRDLFESVLRTGEAYWAANRPFYMERHGFKEETFFDVSYDPVRDETGAVAGVFCIVSETTRRVLGERRLRVLRDLAAEPAEARSVDEACALSAHVLASAPEDVPFAVAYLFEPAGTRARLAATAGVEPGAPASPRELDVSGGTWPLGAAGLVALGERLASVPDGPWPEPPAFAMVLPLQRGGQERPLGALVLGVSARLAFDDEYRGFFGLVASQIAASVANARAGEEERRRAEALAELDRAKTAFFSNVSHELRTPLTLLLGPVEDALEDLGLDPHQRERLVITRRNALRLKKLVDTLLDFSRLEAGRARALYEPVHLGALTADLVSSFRSACEKAGIELHVDCPADDEPAFVDRDMWEKIVFNLLSNALKFTFAGRIEVTVHCVERGFELVVRDTGVGIPAGELPHVFERFRRVEGGRSRTHEGTGIGLALVQELVRLHGGTVEIASTVDVGTTLTVTIPAGDGHLPREHTQPAREPASRHRVAEGFVEEALGWFPEAPAPAAIETGARSRIVWADDNADMREYVRRVLGAHHDVEAVCDGEAALAAIRARRPDLVLADVMMPRLDGFGLLAALRADAATRTIPCVLLSARAGEEARIEGLAAGADDYLVKPFGSRELVARIAARLEIARARREAERRKDEFLAALAHELRNPLAPLRNAVQLLEPKGTEDAEDPERRWARGVMMRQIAHLTRLVDDLLDASRMTHDRLELRKEHIQLARAIEGALEAAVPAIEVRGHELSVVLPPEPVHLEGDLVRLAQVFTNLLVNAAKYTRPGGHIALVARVERDADGRAEAVVSVRDDGIGIPAEQRERVFELFFQGDRSMERAQSGLGVGLALVRRIVDLHGGSVAVCSEGEGKGSEFVVRLPIATAAIEPVLVPASARARSIGRRILIADDLRDSADSLALLMRAAGHEVRTAYDGVEALAIAETFRPETVLLDLGMPLLNGYETCRRLRESEWGRAARVIALTGWGDEEFRRASNAAGFDGHLVKPVDLAALGELLAALPTAR